MTLQSEIKIDTMITEEISKLEDREIDSALDGLDGATIELKTSEIFAVFASTQKK